MRSAALPLLALVALALACAHGDEVEVDTSDERAGRVENTFDDETTLRLVGPDGDVVGDAGLRGGDGTWRLEIEIGPPEEASGWRGFVVRGDCERASGRVVQLSAFAADDDGFESVTTFPRAWIKPDTDYAVTVLDDDGNRVACGQIGGI